MPDQPRLTEAFAAHFKRTFPDLLGRRILVALSGGADSVALLHVLMLSRLDVDLCACHVHHGVRGLDSDDDAAFCRSLCAEHSIRFDLRRITVGDRPAEGREAAWRQARYAALATAASDLSADAIATAHHSDDVAEGVLVQLLRGAGPRALAGIATRAGSLIRPLLPWSHHDLVTWLRTHDKDWREDQSNLSPEHLRNRVRHDVLPYLEACSPKLRRHLRRLADSLADDEAHMAQELKNVASWIDVYDPDGGVPFASIAGLSRALRIRWLHAQAARADIARVTHRQCTLFQSMLDGDLGAVTLADRWVLRRAGGRLWLEPPEKIQAYRHDLRPGQPVNLPLPGWHARVCSRADERVTEARWRLQVSTSEGLVLRSPEVGDRRIDGRPLGALLKKALPRHLRSSWPILLRDDKILWIPGFGVEIGHESGHWTVEVMRS